MKQYEKSVTSQWGEDGVIEEIFNRIGAKNRIAVDIGAWDGKHFSNTWNLWHEKDWTAVLFESDFNRNIQAASNSLGFKVACINKRVEKIDNELGLSCPQDFDLLCIDIDGDDYYLWQDMVKYKPRVVVIEYNQTVPPHISIVQERGGSFGASANALNKLAEMKGYRLVHYTVTNLIFLNTIESDANLFESYIFNQPWHSSINDWICYVVTGYNGKQYRIGEPAHNDNQGGRHEKLITDVKYTPI